MSVGRQPSIYNKDITRQEENLTEMNDTFIFDFRNVSWASVSFNDPEQELYKIEVKIIFVALACISVMSSLMAVTFMHRSKQIPYSAKFLSTGLFSFDALFMIASAIRKFITDDVISISIHAAVLFFFQLSTFTVGLMSLERYIVILYPFRYKQFARKKYVRITVSSIWLFVVCLCIFMRYGVRYIRYRTNAVFTVPSFCFGITSPFYGIMGFVVLVTSCTCYWKIFNCIRCKTMVGNTLSVVATAKRIHSYRSTSIVFIYLIVIIVTALAIGVVLFLTHVDVLQNKILGVSLEVLYTFNCIFDPFIYGFWFKECRMQFVMFLSVFSKRYQRKAEQMRIDVYNIVTR